MSSPKKKDAFDLLGLPEELFLHIINFLDLDSLKNLSEANNLFLDLTSSTVVKKSWIKLTNETELKDVYSSLRCYSNFKIADDAEDLDINDRRFRAKNLAVHRTVLKNNQHVVKYIKTSKTLQHVYVDFGDLARRRDPLQRLSDKVKIIVKKGHFTILSQENIYDQISTFCKIHPEIEDVRIYAGIEISWSKESFFKEKFPFKNLCCCSLNALFFENILENCADLRYLSVQSTHFDKDHLPQQLRELQYTGIIDGQPETRLRNSASLENLLRNQKELETVSIGHVAVTRKALQELENNQNLEVVNFFGSFMEDLRVEDFACLSRVKRLHMHLSQYQDMENLYYMLRNLKQVEYLDIKIPESEEYLAKFEHLKKEKINLPRLNKIACSEKLISKVLSEVILAENLQDFGLFWENNLHSNEFLKSLKRLSTPNPVTLENCKQIFSLKHIDSLFVSLDEVTIDVVKYFLGELDHLRNLDVQFGKLDQDWSEKNDFYMELFSLVGEEHKFSFTKNFINKVLYFKHKNCSVELRILDY